jgi:hypothetical protein
MNKYPEMLKIREEAIVYRARAEKQMLKKMMKASQVSPRTYDQKKYDLDMWVEKEQEEVKKTKKVFEE